MVSRGIPYTLFCYSRLKQALTERPADQFESLYQPTWLQSFLSIWTSPYVTEPQPSKSLIQDVHPFFYFIFSAIEGNARVSFTYQYTNCLIASERCFSFIEMKNVLRKKLN